MILCIFLRNRNGNRNVPYLYRNGAQLVLNFIWLDNNFNRNDRLVRTRELLSFSSCIGRSFFKEKFYPAAKLVTNFYKWC